MLGLAEFLSISVCHGSDNMENIILDFLSSEYIYKKILFTSNVLYISEVRSLYEFVIFYIFFQLGYTGLAV